MSWRLLGVALLAVSSAPAGGSPAHARPHGPPVTRAKAMSGHAFGIEPVSVRLAAGGFMVNFRYRVTDAAKAKPLFHDGVKPELIDARTGARYAMPSDTKLGALRASPRSKPVNGKQYYVLFSNPGRRIQVGSHVNVMLGNCAMRELVVQ